MPRAPDNSSSPGVLRGTRGRSGGTLLDESLPAWTIVKRLLSVAWRHKLGAVPLILVTVVAQTCTLIAFAAQGLAVDKLHRVADPDQAPLDYPLGLNPPAEWSLTATVALIAGVVMGAAGVGAVMRYLNRVTEEAFAQRCVMDLRVRLYGTLQRLDFRFFDEHETGQIINRLTSDARQVYNIIQGLLVRLIIAGVTLTIFLSFMVQQSAVLTAAVLAVLPVQSWVVIRYGKKTKPRFKEQSERVDRLIHRLQESIAGVRVIRAFGRQDHATALFDEDAASARDHRIELAKSQGLHIPAVPAGNMLATALLIGVGGVLIVTGGAGGALGAGLTLGSLVVFRGLTRNLSGQIEAIMWFAAQAPESLAAADRVFRMLETTPAIGEPVEAKALPRARSHAIVFEGVGFRYREDAPEVLSGIDLRIEPGETVAVVGRTGAGKSTLLSLVARLYDPTRGRVTIGGVDLRDVGLGELRSRVSYVFQEPFLFSNTVFNNIAFADPRTPDEAVHAAAESAQASGFIGSLSGGYDTVVGERGVDLSGGQRQRLTIARALVTDPDVLILDDALTAVDPITEALIQRALDHTNEGRTTLIVAHRLSTLRRADRIVVLEGGRVAAVGTHRELMETDSHYKEAALIQLSIEQDGEPAGAGA